MIDLRFPTALQTMLLLAVAQQAGTPSVSSAQIAQGLALHSSFVRKLLIPLVEEGLVVSARGKNGGVHLARPAEQITLRGIYRAVVKDKKIWEARLNVPPRCLVSTHTAAFFEALAEEAENAIMTLLGNRTLGQSLVELERLDKANAYHCAPDETN